MPAVTKNEPVRVTRTDSTLIVLFDPIASADSLVGFREDNLSDRVAISWTEVAKVETRALKRWAVVVKYYYIAVAVVGTLAFAWVLK